MTLCAQLERLNSMAEKITEAQLAESVVAWLEEQHWDVYQEVLYPPFGIVADIVAVRGPLVWVIECKLQFGFAVLEQAERWMVHKRSIAVPRASRGAHRPRRNVLSEFYGVGMLEIDGGRVLEMVNAPIHREYHDTAKRVKSALRPEHKSFAKAGTNRGGHWSPYKETIKAVRKHIEENPGCTAKDIYAALGKCHYANEASAKSGFLNSLMNFEKDWCRLDTSVKPYRFYIREIAT